MTTHVDAMFSNGVFKPDQLLPLPDQARVRLTIEPVEEAFAPNDAWEQLKEWIQHNPLHGLGPRAFRDELHERR